MAHVGMSMILRKKGLYEEALGHCAKALQLNPKLETAYSERGLVLYLRGDYKRSEADYTKAIELNKSDYVVYYNRALSRRSHGDIAGAIDDNSEVIKLNPKLAKTYVNRGQLYYLEKRYDASLSDFREALKIQPGYSYVNLWVYLSRSRMGEQQAATAELRQSLGLPEAADVSNWGHAMTQFILGNQTYESMRMRAESYPVGVKRIRSLCVVEYYAAAKKSLSNDEVGAKSHYQKALNVCPRDSIEYLMASRETS